MRQPLNCYVCKNPWWGAGPVCPNCGLACSICGSDSHEFMDCIVSRTISYTNFNMKYRSKPRTKPYIYNYRPPLKVCKTCKGNYLLESKAGSVCASCKTAIHNSCRNCDSSNTIGIAGDNMQFIECQDCQFIE